MENPAGSSVWPVTFVTALGRGVLHLRRTAAATTRSASGTPCFSRANHSRDGGEGRGAAMGRRLAVGKTHWWRPGRIASCGSDDDRQEAALRQPGPNRTSRPLSSELETIAAAAHDRLHAQADQDPSAIDEAGRRVDRGAGPRRDHRRRPESKACGCAAARANVTRRSEHPLDVACGCPQLNRPASGQASSLHWIRRPRRGSRGNRLLRGAFSRASPIVRSIARGCIAGSLTVWD